MNVMRTLWNYVKINDLQVKVGRGAVRGNGNLARRGFSGGRSFYPTNSSARTYFFADINIR